MWEIQRDSSKGERRSGPASRPADSEPRFKDGTGNTEELLTKIKDGGLADGLDVLSSISELLDELCVALPPVPDTILEQLGLNAGEGDAPTFGASLDMLHEDVVARRRGATPPA